MPPGPGSWVGGANGGETSTTAPENLPLGNYRVGACRYLDALPTSMVRVVFYLLAPLRKLLLYLFLTSQFKCLFLKPVKSRLCCPVSIDQRIRQGLGQAHLTEVKPQKAAYS